MKKLNFVYAVLCLINLVSCNQNPTSSPATESVLSDGMKITALTPSGKINIEAGKTFARSYSGENWSKSSNLIPRNTRWYGSLGLYDPAGSFTKGDRLLIDEGKQFFLTESEALRYMQYISAYNGKLTYNNNGLVIAYKVVVIPNEKPTRNLAVWQFYINGKKPISLRGAVDKNIDVSDGTIADTATPAVAPIGYPRELADKEYDPRN